MSLCVKVTYVLADINMVADINTIRVVIIQDMCHRLLFSRNNLFSRLLQTQHNYFCQGHNILSHTLLIYHILALLVFFKLYSILIIPCSRKCYQEVENSSRINRKIM